MKQFNLEEYLRLKEEGKEPKIVTKVGKPVRILCTDLKSETYPIVAIIDIGKSERVFTCTKDGHFLGEETIDEYDLFFSPTKHEGWVNVYPVRLIGCYQTGPSIFPTEAFAKASATSECIATVKVEWVG